MYRWAVLLALVACDERRPPEPAPRKWTYEPSPSAWPLGLVGGTIGRSQAPQLAVRDGIAGTVTPPLRLPTPWAVPGEGRARAVIYGLAAGGPAVELIDVDAGVVMWRDTTACAAPVVGVTTEAIVCADAKGTRAIGLDGKARWDGDAQFIAITDDRVVTMGPGESIVLDAASGDEIARVKLPAPVMIESILASCGDAGRELFAYGQDGRLVRIVEGAGGPKIAWAVPLATVAGLEACDGETVLVTTSSAAGTSLVALARETGAVTGTIDGVRGYWPARDGSTRLEVSTGGGVSLAARDLAGPREHVALPVLAELLAKRGEQRLVRATPLTAAVLDGRGVRAYLPLAQLGAVLGDRSIVAASWLGSPGETVQRFAIPPRYRRALRVAVPRPPVAVPAELRDLPAVRALDIGNAFAREGVGRYAVADVALDPWFPASGYAITLEGEPDDKATAGVARFDLASRSWAWHRADGCGPGTPVDIAASGELVVCAARAATGANIVATGPDGAARWQWSGNNVDALQAAAGIVIALDADRVHIIDGTDGRTLGVFASDDGGPMRAAALDVDGMAMVVTAEHGRVLARLPRVAMVPAWTIAVAGVVASLAPAGDGVLVALEDGDAYRIDAHGRAVAVPGLDLVWRATGDLVTGAAPGGPIPPDKPPVPAAPPRPRGFRRPPPPPERDPDAPPILPKPWPAPPPMPASWQYTLYELSGALRARNDYALAEPITPAHSRGPAASPLVVQAGPGARDVLVIDPERGDPLRRVQLPEAAAPNLAFSTVVDGKPVVGTLLANPVRVVLF